MRGPQIPWQYILIFYCTFIIPKNACIFKDLLINSTTILFIAEYLRFKRFHKMFNKLYTKYNLNVRLNQLYLLRLPIVYIHVHV